VADNSDVVTAQAALAQASDAEVDTIFRYHLARISLARVLGHVTEELTR
jgi:outer membrane protein TolC